MVGEVWLVVIRLIEVVVTAPQASRSQMLFIRYFEITTLQYQISALCREEEDDVDKAKVEIVVRS